MNTYNFLEEIDGYVCFHDDNTHISRFEKLRTISRIITNGMFVCRKPHDKLYLYEFTKCDLQAPDNDVWWSMILEIEETPRTGSYDIIIMYNTNTKEYVFVQYGDKSNMYLLYDNDDIHVRRNLILTTKHQKLFDKIVDYDLQKLLN